MNIIMIEESKLNHIINTINAIAKKLVPEEEKKEGYTVGEVAKLKGISYQTAMVKVHSGEWMAHNETPSSKRPTYRIYKDEVDRIMFRRVS